MLYATILRAAFIIVVLLVVASCQSAPSPAAPATAAPAAKAPAAPAAQAPAAPAAQAPAAPTAQAPAAPTAPPPAPTAVPEKLKIGISGSFTGGTISYGQNAERFIKMAIEDINAKGGIKVAGKTYMLDSVTSDDKATTEGGVESARRLMLAEKVRFVIGPSGSASLGAQPFLEESKAMLFPYSVSLAGLGPKHPLTFAIQAHNLARARSIYQWALKVKPDLKTVTIIIGNDASSHSNAPSFQKIAADFGVNATIEYNPNNLKDYMPIMARVVNTNPGGLDIEWGSMAPALISTMKALTTLEYKGLKWAYGVDLETVREATQIMEGFTMTVLADWRSDIVGAKEKELFERYIKKWDEKELNSNFITTYDGMMVLAQALEKAGTVEDTEKIAKVLREGEWETTSSGKFGKARFVGEKTFGGLTASLDQPAYLSQVQKGKIVTFEAIGRPGLP